MNCKFITIEENLHRCSTCGYTIKVRQDPNKIYRTCSEKSEPGFIQKGVNFANAMVEWVSAGAPITKIEEKNRRLEICLSCENYDNGKCKLCGCNLDLKILTETAHCPINKW